MQLALMVFDDPDFHSKFRGFMEFDIPLLKDCFLSNIYDFNLTQFTFNMSTQDVLIHPIPNSQDTIEPAFNPFISDTFYFFTHNYRRYITGFVNAYLAEKLRVYANQQVSDYIQTTQNKCSIGPKGYPAPDPIGWGGFGGVPINKIALYSATLWGVVWSCLLFLVLFSIYLYRSIKKGNIFKLRSNRLRSERGFRSSKTVEEVKPLRFSSADESINATGEMFVVSRNKNSNYKTVESTDHDPNFDNYTYTYDGALGPIDTRIRTPNKPGGFSNLFSLSFYSTSIVLGKELPFILRFLVAAIIGVTIGVFIITATSVGGSVYIRAASTLHPFQFVDTPPLFSFSLTNSIRDMWKAGVYPLSILIGLLSGVWPSVKLILMLACWIVPIRTLSFGAGENILRILDALGKWSLIDTWVMVLMLIAFNIEIRMPPEESIPGVQWRVYIEPELGFYLFLVGTMFSLFFTHIVIALHRFVRGRRNKEKLLASSTDADPLPYLLNSISNHS
eukprot:TRINITY_DN4711_c0_g1_i1.p1 TRINITY_DN4711_c0_g1~~TRINITY_DN4711_c0_g1_i1.p1  ORF type:complete len:503 (+),score=61.59 TRINITY_DN4711_c0_g1_i1:531-2039(+)